MQRLPPSRMALLGVGWSGIQVFWAFHGSTLPLFLADLTDSKFRIPLVLSLAGISGCIVPPVVGYVSARTGVRFGRRTPYILSGMLGVLLCVLALPRVPGFTLVATAAMLPMGMLGDRFGRKQVLSSMIALWAVSGLAIAFSQSLPQALVTVGFAASPFAAVMAVGYAFFPDLIPQDRTAEFVGIGVLSIASAQFAGPLLGGGLIDTLGYRSLFPVAAAFQLVGLALLQRVAPPGTERARS